MNTARAAVASLLLLAAPSWAGEIRGMCDMRFHVTSTLHDFSGTARCLPLSAGLAERMDGTAVLPSVEVEVPVEGMDTGNGDRDAQMRKMFQADRFPRIHGVVRNVDVEAVRGAMATQGKAVLDFALRIRDVEQTVPAVVTKLQEDGKRAEFEVEFPVSLKAFGLKAPSVLFFIRVGDHVDVKGKVRLEVVS